MIFGHLQAFFFFCQQELALSRIVDVVFENVYHAACLARTKLPNDEKPLYRSLWVHEEAKNGLVPLVFIAVFVEREKKTGSFLFFQWHSDRLDGVQVEHFANGECFVGAKSARQKFPDEMIEMRCTRLTSSHNPQSYRPLEKKTADPLGGGLSVRRGLFF